jgi:hypothetical protein
VNRHNAVAEVYRRLLIRSRTHHWTALGLPSSMV